MRIGGVRFTPTDMGEAESAADCTWVTPALPQAVFTGDLVMHRIHLSLLQGRSAAYRTALLRVREEADAGTVFLTGHGGLGTPAGIATQLAYLDEYRGAVRDLAAGRPALTPEENAKLVRRVMTFEPSPVLAFLVAQGADPVARELAATG